MSIEVMEREMREKYGMGEPSKETLELHREIMALSHAVQSGVAMEMNLQNGSDAASRKHLRTGLNISMCDMGAMTMLLVSKGLITEEELYKARRDQLKKEVAMYEDRLTKAMGGAKITLG
jgi:hypothetical protein